MIDTYDQDAPDQDAPDQDAPDQDAPDQDAPEERHKLRKQVDDTFVNPITERLNDSIIALGEK